MHRGGFGLARRKTNVYRRIYYIFGLLSPFQNHNKTPPRWEEINSILASARRSFLLSLLTIDFVVVVILVVVVVVVILVVLVLTPVHYGTKPDHFETSKIHFPTSEGVSEVSERASE